MVELQTCASIVNASSALCAIEEVKGESTGGNVVIAEISAELQRERQKNAELMQRISILEAQIQERDSKFLVSNGQGSWPSARERCFKKFKRRKMEPSRESLEGNEMVSQTRCIPRKDANLESGLVNWMSMDDSPFLHFENFKDDFYAADCKDSDNSDDEYLDEKDISIDDRGRKNGANLVAANEKNEVLEGVDKGVNISCLESSSGEPRLLQVSHGLIGDSMNNSLAPVINSTYNQNELGEYDRKETKTVGGYVASSNILTSGQEVGGSGCISITKKPPKMAFCPKEVKRIIESEELLLRNAQSHTIRKIIVFASLGVRHGCEDMYDLDFNHFSILQKGEKYESPNNPGEHVLYENPGVRRKVFYSNQQNSTLCPVQILEEEKAMRPSDAGCPSCLFLCIKYGGRTRNLPQNEYVRQRMGRNKLKSFGPVICQMAMLVHIRSGSFFFKALGITLLFMAGFPDDLVQKETKYRNLDLLQKYYRTDEDAEGEDLFLLHPVADNTEASPNPQQLTGKMIPTKSRGKTCTNPRKLRKDSIVQSTPSSPAPPPTQFGLMGYPMPCHSPFSNQSSHPICPHPMNSFVPMMYWPPPITFPPCPYPSSSGYQSFPSADMGNYISFHPQPCYTPTLCTPLIPRVVESNAQNGAAASEEAHSDSNSSTSSTEPIEE